MRSCLPSTLIRLKMELLENGAFSKRISVDATLGKEKRDQEVNLRKKIGPSLFDPTEMSLFAIERANDKGNFCSLLRSVGA